MQESILSPRRAPRCQRHVSADAKVLEAGHAGAAGSGGRGGRQDARGRVQQNLEAAEGAKMPDRGRVSQEDLEAAEGAKMPKAGCLRFWRAPKVLEARSSKVRRTPLC